MNRLSKEYTTTNNKEKVKAQYTYGKTGGVTLVTNDTSSIANKYDNKGLIMEQKLFEDGKSYAMVYGNNANGKCVYSKIYSNNTGHYGDYDIQQMINYEYDAKGNMTTVSDSLNNSKVMARYTYDSNDNLSSVTYGNGTSTIYTYNNGNMIQTVSNIGTDNKNMSYYSYEYYLDGNVSKQNRNGVNCYYDYDEFSRITDEDYGNEEIDYYYDAAGNRTMKTICDDNGDTEVDYAYDLNNRLLEESNHSYANNKTDVTKYVYDNNGNQIKKIGYTTKGVNGSPSQDLVSENELNNTYEMYKYNEFNEMTSFESNKEAVWYYAYLPNGLRYRKHKNNYNNSDWFVWDRNGNIIAEMNNNKEYTNKYVRGNKLISKDGNEYFGYDGHGSVVNISDESGKSIKSYDYDAFGVELNKDANDTNLFRYCGEQYDNETDSIYLRARYYSPSLGRFTTEDPAKDGDNWYSYCAGNPVNSWDPSGNAAYGGISVIQNLAEAVYDAIETNSVGDPISGIIISNWARDKGVEYAKKSNYYNDKGELVTWDNKADAYRHFLWNARMTRELGKDSAEIIGNKHEHVTWDSKKVSGGTIFNIPFSSLMDLNNNGMGRSYAKIHPDYGYDDLWKSAMKDKNIITSLSQVQEFYHLSDEQIFSSDNSNLLNKKYIKVYVPDDKKQKCHIMNKNENFNRIEHK